MTSPPFPAGPEGDEPNLRRALGELPSHEPDAAGWDAIAARLAGEPPLTRAIAELPSHEPAPNTWAQITARLDRLAAPPPKWRLRPRRRWALSLSLAASLLLLVAAGLAWWRQPAGPAPVAVAPPRPTLPLMPAMPAMPTLPPPPAADPLDEQGEAFIEAHCTSLPQVCQSGQFQALRARLSELQQQEQQLRLQTQRRGATPQLEQQQVQLTIRKASVTRELIHLLIT